MPAGRADHRALGRWPPRRPAGAAPAPAPATPPAGQTPTFRVSVDLITTDLIVRDSRDQFIADLKPGEIEIYEDGVKQDIASLELIHGGRAYSVQAPPPAPVQEGIILPRNRPTNDTAGRVFLLFIDDLHLDFRETPRTRDLLKRMLKNLIHDGDMFGIVTTGTSSISQQLTYDRQVLDSAISRITGNALKPSEIIQGGQGSNGPDRTAPPRARRVLDRLRADAEPREAAEPAQGGHLHQQRLRLQSVRAGPAGGDGQARCTWRTPTSCKAIRSSASSRASRCWPSRTCARAGRADARRQPRQRHASTRSTRAGWWRGRISTRRSPIKDWNEYLRETQDSLRVLAEQTGGIAVVNQNDFNKALKRIDAETSDYYVLGYYSSNPDPLKRTRKHRGEDPKRGRASNASGRARSYSLRPVAGCQSCPWVGTTASTSVPTRLAASTGLHRGFEPRPHASSTCITSLTIRGSRLIFG